MKDTLRPPEPDQSAFNSAFQSVAQSTALALSDATDNLRNLNTLSTTAIGTALSQMLETGDLKYAHIIEQAQKVVTNGADNFGVVGEKIATVLYDASK
ncbi:RebB family R body protein [Vibrio rhizosphaerae]|uniref:RebB family R body protein n=1 Tax=Vibrio rhizosphaerae TaxID=398736 RepID=A0ABU4IWW9_9VIBR|nr:RebB family R body protein [Vibrio rhizosphaerae]MDW6093875.1 RebB family R body protein [Vibrio rhizosphaerae]